jgi:hypothetical protein
MAFARLLFSFLFLFFWLTAALADGQRVILVLDASGSMWGQIGSKSKMDIAKQVVGKVIGTWKPEDELGLVAYGHRKKGACDDIETLIPPGPLDAGLLHVVGARAFAQGQDADDAGRAPGGGSAEIHREAGDRHPRLGWHRDLRSQPLRRGGVNWKSWASASPCTRWASGWTTRALSTVEVPRGKDRRHFGDCRERR